MNKKKRMIGFRLNDDESTKLNYLKNHYESFDKDADLKNDSELIRYCLNKLYFIVSSTNMKSELDNVFISAVSYFMDSYHNVISENQNAILNETLKNGIKIDLLLNENKITVDDEYLNDKLYSLMIGEDDE